MPFLPSRYWTGRSVYTWQTITYSSNEKDRCYKSHYFGVSYTHNVLIPRFENIMLVLVKDQVITSAQKVYTSGFNSPIKVHRGSRTINQMEKNWVTIYIRDITGIVVSRTTNGNYVWSSTNMADTLKDMKSIYLLIPQCIWLLP